MRLRFHGPYVFRALSNALVPDCSFRLNNLRIPSYVLIKQLILNQKRDRFWNALMRTRKQAVVPSCPSEDSSVPRLESNAAAAQMDRDNCICCGDRCCGG
jgi:hypothetical protein